jgi:hypothetical protein
MEQARYATTNRAAGIASVINMLVKPVAYSHAGLAEQGIGSDNVFRQ